MIVCSLPSGSVTGDDKVSKLIFITRRFSRKPSGISIWDDIRPARAGRSCPGLASFYPDCSIPGQFNIIPVLGFISNASNTFDSRTKLYFGGVILFIFFQSTSNLNYQSVLFLKTLLFINVDWMIGFMRMCSRHVVASDRIRSHRITSERVRSS